MDSFIPLQNPATRCYVNSVIQFFLTDELLKTNLLPPLNSAEEVEQFVDSCHKNYCEKAGIDLNEQDSSNWFLSWFLDRLDNKDLFQIKLKTMNKCKRCNTSTFNQNDENFFHTSASSYKQTLLNSLNTSFVESVERKCANCGFDKCKKILKVEKYPDYFFILINQQTNFKLSIDYGIDFETKHENYSYDIQAFIEHIGTVQSGHYKMYVQKNDEWFCLNDEQIKPVREEVIEKKMEGSSKIVCCLYRLQ